MKMKKEFDWNKFKTEKIAVNCKTQKEANQFFSEMINQGISDAKTKDNFWNTYKRKTCYNLSEYGRWMFCHKEHYKSEGYVVLKFSDYFDVDEPTSHYGEIEINGDCFIIKERDECSNAEWMYLCNLFGLDYDATERIVIDGIVKYFGLRKDEV